MKRSRKFSSNNVHCRKADAKRKLRVLPKEAIRRIAKSECRQLSFGVRLKVHPTLMVLILAVDSELIVDGREITLTQGPGGEIACNFDKAVGSSNWVLPLYSDQEFDEILASYILAARELARKWRLNSN